MELEESTTYQALIAKGKMKHARHLLLRLGTDRFGEPTKEVKNKIESLADLNELDRLIMRLLHVSSWQELFER